MAISSIYRLWGFTGNPFSPMPLQADEVGNKLLIGRTAEVKALTQRLATPPNIPTIEGLNGIGKTSLINVALYRCFQESLHISGGPILIPCRERFQLRDDIEPQDFAFEILLEVAQTLVENKEILRLKGHQLPGVERVDRWLNSPELASYQASFAGFGTGYARSAGAMGFNDSGFKKIIKGWLAKIFPTPDSGGVVCILDNIEIMRSSARAREIAEDLRDPVFSIPGVRWILCGALGIMYGIARSPRLQGILTNPVEVGPIESQSPDVILHSRIATFSLDEKNYFMPIASGDFSFLFQLMRGHIRNVLSEANSFCHWIEEKNWRHRIEAQPTFARVLFQRYVKNKSQKALIHSREYVREISWLRLDEIARLGGVVALRDLSTSGDDTGAIAANAQLKSEIRELLSAGLLTNVHDPSGETRHMIHVTAEGWFALYGTKFEV